MKPGMAIMVIDFLVISFAGFVIHIKDLSADKPALSLTLYAFFLLFISAKIIDVILDGFDYARSAFIITSEHEQVSKIIINDLSRGATAIKARGLYSNESKEMLYTVLSRKEISKLAVIVKKVDPHALYHRQ